MELQLSKSQIKKYIEQIENEDKPVSLTQLRNIAKKLKFTTKDRLEKIYDYLGKKYIPYPDKNDEDFFKKIFLKKEFNENQYKLDVDGDTEEVFEKLCGGDRDDEDNNQFQLLSHQILMRNYININTPYNGVLLFHGMGTGKTCSAIAIAEAYRKSISDMSSFSKVLVLTSGTTISANFKTQIHDIRKGYNQCTFSNYINYKPYDTELVKQKKVDALIDKNYEFQGYQRMSNKIANVLEEFGKDDPRFAEYIQNNYSDRIIIVDEVHNLKKKNKKTDIKIKRYKAVKYILKHSKNVKLILLSGTPVAHQASEIIDILNLLLINDNFSPLDKKTYKKKIFNPKQELTSEGKKILRKYSKGYISFLTSENKYTFPKKKFPDNSVSASTFINQKFHPIVIYPENEFDVKREFKLVICEMKGQQMKTYKKYLTENSQTKKNASRTNKGISPGILTQLQLCAHDHKKKNATLQIPPRSFEEDNISNISIKFYKLLQNVKKSKGPVFIYSFYLKTSIFMIAHMFIRNGIKFWSKQKEIPYLLGKSSSNKVQICALCGKNIILCQEEKQHEFIQMSFDIIVSATPEDTRQQIMQRFNHPSNLDGKMLKIIIGSYVLREGINFLRVRQLHIMEPWHNKSRLAQIIGRGRRHCSHRLLPEEERNITLFIYCCVLGQKHNVDTSKNNKAVELKIKKRLKDLTETNYKKQQLSRQYGSESENGILLSYDMIMYKRAEILQQRIQGVEKLLKENAIDCMLNRAINIDVFDDDEKPYECNDYNKFNKDNDIIDESTYNNIFLTPYIQYTISIIRSMFEKRLVVYESEIYNKPQLQSNIYKNKLIVKKAFHNLLIDDDDYIGPQHTIKHRNTYGYLITREINTDDSIYIFKKFEDQKIEKSPFEISPIYEMYYMEQIDNDRAQTVSLNGIIKLVQFEDDNQEEIQNPQEYIEILKQGKAKKKSRKKDTDKYAQYLALYNPKPERTNDAPVIGIQLNVGVKPVFIRSTSFKKGRYLPSIPKFESQKILRELLTIINNIIEKSESSEETKTFTDLKTQIDNMFKRANKEQYNKDLAQLIILVLKALQQKKFNGKKWFIVV